MPTRLRRSCLAVPGADETLIAAARAHPADEVVLDLEDGVAPADKDVARALVAAALARGGFPGTRTVRVNGIGSGRLAGDLAALRDAPPDCIVLPKVESPEQVAEAAGLLPADVTIEAQIETPRGLVEVERIARAPRLEALIFGPGDFSSSMGIAVETVGESDPAYPGDQWHYALARIAVAARAFGLHAIDGPFARLGDPGGFRAAATRARLLGFDGKWVIEPEQVAPANELFAQRLPSAPAREP